MSIGPRELASVLRKVGPQLVMAGIRGGLVGSSAAVFRNVLPPRTHLVPDPTSGQYVERKKNPDLDIVLAYEHRFPTKQVLELLTDESLREGVRTAGRTQRAKDDNTYFKAFIHPPGAATTVPNVKIDFVEIGYHVIPGAFDTDVDGVDFPVATVEFLTVIKMLTVQRRTSKLTQDTTDLLAFFDHLAQKGKQFPTAMAGMLDPADPVIQFDWEKFKANLWSGLCTIGKASNRTEQQISLKYGEVQKQITTLGIKPTPGK